MKIVRIDQLRERVLRLYESGMPRGDKTGWPDLDKHYTVAPGMLTILTGWPGSGKSEWLDALMLNLAYQGWSFAIFSPENLPHELHISKWLEKVTNKPFRSGPTERMSVDEVKEAIDDVAQRFFFLDHKQDEPVSMHEILRDASVFFDDDFSDAKHGLIVDPWNELEHMRPAHMSMTEHVAQTLGMVRQWARERRIHVWIVAHPQKLKRMESNGKLPIPTPDTISDSQHWWNKADACITVHRDLSDPKCRDVDIHVQKMRFKHLGRPGMVTLRYDRLTGRYSQLAKQFSVVRDDEEDE
jgi:twinkle protein